MTTKAKKPALAEGLHFPAAWAGDQLRVPQEATTSGAARVQHMKNRRRELEDLVDAIAAVDGLPQIQLRLTHAGTPKAFGSSMFRQLNRAGVAVAVSILQHGNRSPKA